MTYKEQEAYDAGKSGSYYIPKSEDYREQMLLDIAYERGKDARKPSYANREATFLGTVFTTSMIVVLVWLPIHFFNKVSMTGMVGIFGGWLVVFATVHIKYGHLLSKKQE